MEFYDRKDLEYWRKQAALGKAVIIEIPMEMLLDLDIEELSRAHNAKISPEELTQWIEENREAFTAAAASAEKKIAEAEQLERELYGSNSEAAAEHKPVQTEEDELKDHRKASETEPGKMMPPADLSTDQKVSWIMEHTEFTEEQIGIIAEAMSQELPSKYLLCFMKREYSPAVMRQLKDYCTKMFKDERRE